MPDDAGVVGNSTGITTTTSARETPLFRPKVFPLSNTNTAGRKVARLETGYN